VRTDTIDQPGKLTLRHHGLHHIGIGHRWAGTDIHMLIADLDIRIIATNTGELIRELKLDPTRDYQPQKQKHPQPTTEGVHYVPRHPSSMSGDFTGWS
jgi:hypothetical protein